VRAVTGRGEKVQDTHDQAFQHPKWGGLAYRIAQTISWGSTLRDRLLIAAYYGLLASVSAAHLRRMMTGMYPQFWLGDIRVSTPLGRFECRGGTTDFDIVNPNYESAVIKIVREKLSDRPGGPQVFLDVGAHIGKYAILAGRLLRNTGRVIAFEPEPDNFRLLQKNVALNGLANVRCLNVGCWSHDGSLKLYRARGNLGGHSFLGPRGGESVEVSVRTLDSVLPEQGTGSVDMIKIDVERGESHVLRGARRILESSPRVMVLVEESGNPGTSSALRFLSSIGFRVRHLAGITYLGTPNNGLPSEPSKPAST